MNKQEKAEVKLKQLGYEFIDFRWLSWEVQIDRAGIDGRSSRALLEHFSSRKQVIDYIQSGNSLLAIDNIGVKARRNILAWLGME